MLPGSYLRDVSAAFTAWRVMDIRDDDAKDCEGRYVGCVRGRRRRRHTALRNGHRYMVYQRCILMERYGIESLKIFASEKARRSEIKGEGKVRLWPCFLGLDCDQLEEFPRKTISRDTNIYLAVI